MPIRVTPIPCLSDNYAWLLEDEASGEVALCDPGEAGPALAALPGGRCDWVLLTHHHGDHVGGVAEVVARTGARVVGAAADSHRLPRLDLALAEALVAELGWAGRFRAVLGADSRPWKKPDPRHLTDTLAAANGRAAIFVGDSRTDADTAKAAGVPLVLVSFGYSTEPVEALGADALIHHFDALVRAVAGIQGQFTRDRTEQGA
jgi:beta-phosphoglucomutase-like phosphatase (HAD superfamily)